MVCRCVNERARIPVGADSYPPGRFAAARGARAHIECAPTVRQIRKAGIMKNTKTKRMLAVAALLAVGLALMLYYAAHKQGYHVDELYTYELANYPAGSTRWRTAIWTAGTTAAFTALP